MHDLIVVGSGPAGYAAALAQAGRGIVVIDPGFVPSGAPEGRATGLLEAKRSGTIDRGEIIGESFESLHNIHGEYLSPKLKGPRMRFITAGAAELAPVRTDGFLAAVSLARGGLANAWGAGAFRYDRAELAAFPFAADELAEPYRTLIERIGVTGVEDDLSPTFGPAAGHLPPPVAGMAGGDLLGRYARQRDWLRRRGMRIGQPRLALLTRPHRGRTAYAYDGMEFFRPHDQAIFNPGRAVADLAAEGAIELRGGLLVERFAVGGDGIEVFCRGVADGVGCTLRTRRLCLAAGALNTARIVLASARDHAARLPVRDNPISYIPLLDPRRIGSPHDPNCLPAQAVLVLDRGWGDEPVQMTFYGLNATLWGDLAFDMPVPAPQLHRMIRSLLPAMRIVQAFYPDTGEPRGWCRLGDDGALEICYRQIDRGALEARVMRLMRRLGYFGLPALCRYPSAGNSFHYAGTLPMRRFPGAYETAPDGSLAGAPGVHVLDAANFPVLPSKNLTLTIMANSLRIAAALPGPRG